MDRKKSSLGLLEELEEECCQGPVGSDEGVVRACVFHGFLIAHRPHTIPLQPPFPRPWASQRAPGG